MRLSAARFRQPSTQAHSLDLSYAFRFQLSIFRPLGGSLQMAGLMIFVLCYQNSFQALVSVLQRTEYAASTLVFWGERGPLSAPLTASGSAATAAVCVSSYTGDDGQSI